MSGRTSWWSKDAAWHRRELNVELGLEFGADGPFLVDVLWCWAQEQGATGLVKGGWNSLSREAFVTVSHARHIVEKAAEIGALKDLVIDDDGRRFTCEAAGFATDAGRGRAAARQASKRLRDAESSPSETVDEAAVTGVTDRDKSRSVTESPPPDLTKPLEEEEARGRAVNDRDPASEHPAGVHRQLDDVVAILTAPGTLDVEPLAVNAALMANLDRDPIVLAQIVASWALDPKPMRTTSANRLLLSAAQNVDRREARVAATREIEIDQARQGVKVRDERADRRERGATALRAVRDGGPPPEVATA